jgi:hypothetical protein
MRITSTGTVGIGSTPGSAVRMVLSGSQTLGSNTQYFLNQQTIQSDATGTSVYFDTFLNAQATPFTASSATHYRASQQALSGGATITNQFGFSATSGLVGATNNFGFYGNIPAGTNRWNFYANGTAANYFAGQVQLGAGTAAAPALSAFGDTNTGLFFPAADTLALVEGGVEAMRINSDAQTVVLAGTALLPSVTFSGDVNTGIYSPGADRIGFAEGGTQVGEFDASGNFLFNSGYGSTAIAYGCRAWVNFDGTTNVAGNCTIRASGNVSSVADNGTGDFTINFTTAMPDANYGFTAGIGRGTSGTDLYFIGQAVTLPTASALRLTVRNAGGATRDPDFVCAAIFR